MGVGVCVGVGVWVGVPVGIGVGVDVLVGVCVGVGLCFGALVFGVGVGAFMELSATTIPELQLSVAEQVMAREGWVPAVPAVRSAIASQP
jgi:hypothetical protein